MDTHSEVDPSVNVEEICAEYWHFLLPRLDIPYALDQYHRYMEFAPFLFGSCPQLPKSIKVVPVIQEIEEIEDIEMETVSVLQVEDVDVNENQSDLPKDQPKDSLNVKIFPDVVEETERNDAENPQEIENKMKRLSFESFRLPNTTVPNHYNLFLDSNIHLNDFAFTGSVQIQLTVMENTRQIVLHSSRNRIINVQMFNSEQVPVTLDSVELDNEKEFLVINTSSTLMQFYIYQLVVEFSGDLRNDMLGFYRSSYVDAEGIVRYIAVTQFQASNARSAFPCFDEPGIRATFSISIGCGRNYGVTSNMPIMGTTILPNKKKISNFEMTPRMPAYLVAFMISDFISNRTTLQEPTKLEMGIFARSTVASGELKLGLQTGAKAIRAIEQYFDRTYDLPKLDQVAVPDFYFGAMENWGLVKYAEPYLLFNEETESNRQKENVITIITHEFVHQFFGNLVTPRWWTDIFLSEGFATLYQYYIGAEIEPTIRYKEMFAVEALQTALYVDSWSSTRPLSYYVENDPMSQFDVIAYQKGASVFRMMNYALGESTFQSGVRRYLEVNKDSAVDPLDLFDSLQYAAQNAEALPINKTVAMIMSPWVYQSGYPLVTVLYSNDKFTFEQKHFSEEPDSERTWWIPLSFVLSIEPDRDETQTVAWIPQDSKYWEITWSIPDDAYLLVNPHQTGYYRVNYDSNLWNRLINQLGKNHSVIPPVSRAQLIDDSFKLVQAGMLNLNTSFELFQYLAAEVDYIPWFTAFASDNLQYINDGLVADADGYRAFQRFLLHLTDKLFWRVGFDETANEPHEYQRLRPTVVEWNCRMGSYVCRGNARQLMVWDLEEYKPLSSYMKHSVYCGGLMDANSADFNAVLEVYRASTDAAERTTYISALGCTENEELLRYYLSLTLDGVNEDWGLIFRSVYSRNNIGFEAFLDWLAENLDRVAEIYSTKNEFISIGLDIELRLKSIGKFEELIGLLQKFQIKK
ncbi:aminopeptidase N-like [Sabethes cyaneus]|uniref:aminopeptidase N-like n=1 Tax=Sabethes cyaneus TaxID=53552 RepID=UPI00237D5953|nr:aminopeptidase N-like [Sabethes cyaneus]